MSVINNLEPKYGRFAIAHLVPALAVLQLLVFFIAAVKPSYYELLALDLQAVGSGQVWRLVSWILLPSRLYTNTIFAIFATLIFIMIGRNLEEAWGTFRINVFFLTSVVALSVVSLVAHFLGHTAVVYVSSVHFSFYIYSALFLSFAIIFPNVEFRLYFFIPVKVKWLGILGAAFVLFEILGNPELTAFALAGHLPFFVWAVPIGIREFKRRSQVAERRSRFQRDSVDQGTSFHSCHACSKTEQDDPNLEFRVSAEDGEEYCNKCLSKKSSA